MKRHAMMMILAATAFVTAPPASAAPDIYRIDSQHTFTSFEYEHWGLSLQRGRFDDTAGTIMMDAAGKGGMIDIEIATASVNTGSAVFDKILRSADFFDAGAHPKITFKSSRLVFDGERLTHVEGDLTIKGITRRITLEMTRFHCRFMIIHGKRACGANGIARMARSEFELGRYVPFVSDQITLHVAVEALRDAPAAGGAGG